MQAIYRVIDANINRAKEGLRVVEDICRFVLEDSKLTDQIKQIRHELTKLVNIPDRLLVEARGSAEDVARERPVPKRQTIRQTFTANAKRAAEAIRVLEEFLPQGSALKDQRYLVYDLEKTIWQKLILKLPFEKTIYVVSAEASVLIKAAQVGAGIIQLRDKNANPEQIKTKVNAVKAQLQDKDTIFILNDYPELAMELGVHGVHIGQDTDLIAVRKKVGPNFIIGQTTHQLAQAKLAKQNGANYISAGPVYATPTKPGRPAVGVEYVQEVAAWGELPFVAIGGIDNSNIDGILAAGAQTIGIVRAAEQLPALLDNVKNYAN